MILTSLSVSQSLKISESRYDIRKIFGVGVESELNLCKLCNRDGYGFGYKNPDLRFFWNRI